MSIKRIFIATVFILPSLCFTQNLERKGKFFFNIGPEYRITPVYDANSSILSNDAFYTNPDLQNSGIAFNLGVDYYITNNLSMGFNNSFRYDIITTQSTQTSTGQGVSVSKKGLLIGYHFKMIYHFQVFRKGDLLVSAGFSLLNRNSEFTIEKPIYDDNGQLLGTINSLVDYKYSAYKISLGYGNKKSKLMLGLYITGNSGYFEKSTTFMVPFISYSFDFGKL
jgi:hypothetical protein